MNEKIEEMISDEFGECLNTEELALKYAELYVFLREQLHFCMNTLTRGDEE